MAAETEYAATAAELAAGDGTPVILVDALEGWAPAERWAPAELRTAVAGLPPEALVLCSDRVPALPGDRPPGRTLRVAAGEYAAYLAGDRPNVIAEYEQPDDSGGGGDGERAEELRLPFQTVGWAPLSACPALAALVPSGGGPRGVTDLSARAGGAAAEPWTPRELQLGPPGSARRLHQAPQGLHTWQAQLRGRRQIRLYSPADTGRLPNKGALPAAFGSDASLFGGPLAHVAELQPGETLIVPMLWWLHASVPRGADNGGSVALQKHFADASNIAQLCAVAEAARAARRAAARARGQARRALLASALVPQGGPGASPAAEDPFAAAEVEAALRAELAADREADPDATDAEGRDLCERAEEKRSLGNALFGRGRWADAVEAYTGGLKLVGAGDADEEADGDEARRGLRAALRCNRAAALLRAGRPAEAKADCDGVLRAGRADALAVKALFRRAKAHEGLGNADAAERDLKRVVELEPHNAAASSALEEYRSIFHRIAVLGNAPAAERARRRAGN